MADRHTSSATEWPVCEVCGATLPRYRLDRATDTECSNVCADRAYGRNEGAAAMGGLICMALAIQENHPAKWWLERGLKWR